MEQTVCRECGSENVYYSKKKKCFVCEDCGCVFSDDDKRKGLKIFLSYGHDENAIVVDEIHKRLIQRGHNPWIDKYEIKSGRNWRVEITKGIKESEDFLAFISNYSTRNPGVCLDEIAIAIGTRSCQIQTILLEKNVSVPSSIGTRQWIDLSDWKKKYDEGGKVWNEWLDAAADEIVAVVENPSNIKKTGDIGRLVNLFQSDGTTFRLHQLLDATLLERSWLLQKVRTWNSGNSKVLLVTGGPGSGKSVLCAQLSNYMPECVGVYFFEWNNAESRRLSNVLSSVLLQLCCNIDDYRELIMMKDLSAASKMSDEVFLEDLILSPLQSLIDGQREKCFVVLDAIDELLVEDNAKVMNVLSRLVRGTPSWLRWLLACRSNSEIFSHFVGAEVVDIDSHQSQIKKDISDFCESMVPNVDVVKRIVSKCEGSFIYARGLVEAVNAENVDLDWIDRMPSSISVMYLNNFARLFDNKDYDSYKPLLASLLAAQEPLSRSTLRTIVGLGEASLTAMLERLKPFLYEDNAGGSESVYSIFHKSFSDWLTSDQAYHYRLTVDEGHSVFASYLLSNIDAVAENQYLSKHAITHLRNAKKWLVLEFTIKKQLLTNCINAADIFGNLYYERHFIELYEQELGEDLSLLVLKLRYLQKTSSEQLNDLIPKMFGLSEQCDDEDTAFIARVKAAVALFYLGKDNESREILLKERGLHGDAFWNNAKNEAQYSHALCLSAHDMDYNNDVVSASDVSARIYLQQNNIYKRQISLVNKFDALMAVGRLYEAFSVAQSLFVSLEERYYVHVDDILQLCYANLLQTAGRVVESLYYYEQGLRLAADIHQWDYLYGSIWRELAIARFGDPSCLARMSRYSSVAHEAKYTYLFSLGECFYIMAFYLLRHSDDRQSGSKERLAEAYRNVSSAGYRGHKALADAAFYLKNWWNGDITPLDYDTVSAEIRQCDGIKGCPEVLDDFLKLENAGEEEHKWRDTFIEPVLKYRETYYQTNIAPLSDEPLLQYPDCVECQSKCCYDGVYLSDRDAQKLTSFVKEHSEFFTNLKADFIVQGSWKGLEHLKKTNVRPFEYDGYFPKHFNRTRCVFCNDDGRCALQVAATELQMHPWSVKPQACWSFPIHGIRDGVILPPPRLDEPDPNYIDESYPGYVTCLECGKARTTGVSWKDIYKNEIMYYLFLQHKGEL